MNGESRVRRRQRRVKIREDVELGNERGALVHVLVVAAGPVEGFSGGAFQALQIDVLMLEDGHVFRCEVVADDGDHAHRREMAGGKREITGGAAEHAICFPCGVSIPSNATEPTTSKDMNSPGS